MWFSVYLSLPLVVLGFDVSYCVCDDWNVWAYFISLYCLSVLVAVFYLLAKRLSFLLAIIKHVTSAGTMDWIVFILNLPLTLSLPLPLPPSLSLSQMSPCTLCWINWTIVGILIKRKKKKRRKKQRKRWGREGERERWHHFFLFARKLIYLLPQLLLRR